MNFSSLFYVSTISFIAKFVKCKFFLASPPVEQATMYRDELRIKLFDIATRDGTMGCCGGHMSPRFPNYTPSAAKFGKGPKVCQHLSLPKIEIAV